MKILEKRARITSKGQITVPQDIRRLLGVQSGDSLVFRAGKDGVRVKPLRASSPFEKYRGIGNPGIPSGRNAIREWMRKMRGE
jgi:AbrB family looped-hinge helix DNA binding protein